MNHFLMNEAYFEHIKPIIAEKLINAKKSVKVISSYFSDSQLFDILCKISKKGIKVELIISDVETNINQSNIVYSKLTDANGKIYLTNRSPNNILVHHKFCIIDEQIVITGSFNWTYGANKNRENIVILNNEKLVTSFLSEFEFVHYNYCNSLSFNEIPISFGFKKLNDIAQQMHPSELICVTDSDNSFSSDFVLSMILKIIETDPIKIGFITSNSNPNRIVKKMQSFLSGIQINKLIAGELELYEWKELHEKSDYLSTRDILFDESGNTFESLKQKCLKQSTLGANIIVIDDINFLLSGYYTETLNYSNQVIFEKLKGMSRQFRIPIVFIIDSKNITYKKNQQTFDIDKTKLDRWVDTVIKISNEESYQFDENSKGSIEVKFEKQIRGATESILMTQNTKTGSFIEVKDSFDENPFS